MSTFAVLPHAGSMENPLIALSDELAAIVANAGQSVVTVHGRPRIASSGVVWKPGVIVTAEHTLRRDEDLRITLPDGSTVPAEIAGRDSGTDIAILRAETGEAAAAIVKESTALKAGHLVLAIGRSQDTGVSAALGVISSLSGPWHTWRGGKLDQFVRLDVGLYPGASGGAIVGVDGSLVGIATGGLSRTSPLAIPVETVARVAAALLDKGHIARGYLGVGLQPVTLPEHLKQKTGLIVLSVEPDGPAAQAGVVIGDVLLSLDGSPVSDTGDVQAVLGAENVGKAVRLSIVRGGSLAELTITIGERPRRRV
jgi:S1-C subfamily serine protease